MKTKTILIITLCCLFVSCGVSNKALISKAITSQYAVNEQSDLPIKDILEKVDTFYYNKNKKSYREVELKFKDGNTDKITSYILYLTEFNDKGKWSKIDEYYLPIREDLSLENPNHIKNGTGQPDNSWSYIYNDAGNRIETLYYRTYRKRTDKERTERVWRDVFSYDKKKNVTEKTRYYDWEKDTLKILNQYDRKGNKTSEMQYTVSDSINRGYIKTLYTYNKQGDIETEEYINELEKVYSKKRYEYTYNENKHWIKKVEYRNGKPYKISEREFEYYENNEKNKSKK